MKSISIIFPVHNEFDNLEKLLSDWATKLNSNKIEYEFVIVEDGSTDGTKELIQKLESLYNIVNLCKNEKRGYSKAVIDGIYASTKKYLLCTDSDNQIKKTLIENINILPDYNEFIIGFGIQKRPINRLIYSWLFKNAQLLFRTNLKDPSCPFVIGLSSTFKSLDKTIGIYERRILVGFCSLCKRKD